jgi:hypothetical protein
MCPVVLEEAQEHLCTQVMRQSVVVAADIQEADPVAPESEQAEAEETSLLVPM